MNLPVIMWWILKQSEISCHSNLKIPTGKGEKILDKLIWQPYFDGTWCQMKESCLIKPNIANRKGGNCFGKMNFAVTFCCTLMPNEGFWCDSYDHCALCVHLGPHALILLFYSWKVTNPISQKEKTFLKYHMIIIGTHLWWRGITCHEEGKTKNEVRISLGDWMIR